MIVKFVEVVLYYNKHRPEPRHLVTVDMPSVPARGEEVQIGNIVYRVHLTSYTIQVGRWDESGNASRESSASAEIHLEHLRSL